MQSYKNLLSFRLFKVIRLHCENCERRGGSQCFRRLCRQRVTAKQASLTPSDRTPTMGAGWTPAASYALWDCDRDVAHTRLLIDSPCS